MKIKLAAVALSTALALATSTTHAGDVNLLGNLNVNSNLTAQSVNLGGATQTNWNFAPLQGYKYVMVAEGTNDVQRGNNLLAAYATATTLGPSSSNRVAVIVPPGAYNLGTTGLLMNTSCVDLTGLVPAQMTAKQVFTASDGTMRTKTVADVHCPVTIYSAAGNGTLQQSAQDVRIESVILENTTGNFAYSPSVSDTNTVLRHVAFTETIPSDPMPYYPDYNVDYSGTYIDCEATAVIIGSGPIFSSGALGTFVDCAGGDGSFGGQATESSGTPASGTFIDCTGGEQSFATYSICNGVFVNCVAGDGSFGAVGIASGTFRNCVGGYGSFGGYGTASGNFTDCVGGWSSFGGLYIASGTFTRCTGGGGSFGSWGTLSGTCIDCTDGTNGFGVWGTLATNAVLRHCQALGQSFGSFLNASSDFNYNATGTNTFLMLPKLPTSTNGLPSGTVYNSSGSLKVMP